MYTRTRTSTSTLRACFHFMYFPLDLTFVFLFGTSLGYSVLFFILCVMSFQSHVRNCRIQEYVQYFDVVLVVIPLLTLWEMELYCTSTHKLDNFFMWIFYLVVFSFGFFSSLTFFCSLSLPPSLPISTSLPIRNWIVSAFFLFMMFPLFDEKLHA